MTAIRMVCAYCGNEEGKEHSKHCEVAYGEDENFVYASNSGTFSELATEFNVERFNLSLMAALRLVKHLRKTVRNCYDVSIGSIADNGHIAGIRYSYSNDTYKLERGMDYLMYLSIESELGEWFARESVAAE